MQIAYCFQIGHCIHFHLVHCCLVQHHQMKIPWWSKNFCRSALLKKLTGSFYFLIRLQCELKLFINGALHRFSFEPLVLLLDAGGHVAAWSSNTAPTHIWLIISASRNCTVIWSRIHVARKLNARSSSGPITKNLYLLGFVFFPSNMGVEIEFSNTIYLAYFAPKGRY